MAYWVSHRPVLKMGLEVILIRGGRGRPQFFHCMEKGKCLFLPHGGVAKFHCFEATTFLGGTLPPQPHLCLVDSGDTQTAGAQHKKMARLKPAAFLWAKYSDRSPPLSDAKW